MKFTAVFAVVGAAATLVGAVPAQTNAERLARGLPPLPPVRRGTGVAAAKRTGPSSTPGQCNTGPVQCCNNVGTQSQLAPLLGPLLGLLGVVLGPIEGLLGLGCSPISVIGVGGNSCNAQPVCCTGNKFNGLINIGCSPINL